MTSISNANGTQYILAQHRAVPFSMTCVEAWIICFIRCTPWEDLLDGIKNPTWGRKQNSFAVASYSLQGQFQVAEFGKQMSRWLLVLPKEDDHNSTVTNMIHPSRHLAA